jgi:hypothetical protein
MADTKTVDLDREYRYAGVVYGPGEAEVPEGFNLSELEDFDPNRRRRLIPGGGVHNPDEGGTARQSLGLDATTSDYNDLTVDELKTELDNRGVAYDSGDRKADLVQALEEDDRA